MSEMSVDDLLARQRDDARRERDEALGKIGDLKSEIGSLKNTIDELTKDREALQARAEQLEDQRDGARCRITHFEIEVSELKDELAVKAERIGELEERIANHADAQDLIDHLNHKINAQASVIRELRGIIADAMKAG